MQEDAYLKCVHPKCGLVYPISSTNVQCEKGHVLDVKYKNTPSTKLKDTFYEKTLWINEDLNISIQFSAGYSWGALELTPDQYELIDEMSYDENTYDTQYNAPSRFDIKVFERILFANQKHFFGTDFCIVSHVNDACTGPDETTLKDMANLSWFKTNYNSETESTVNLFKSMSENDWTFKGYAYLVDGEISVTKKNEYDFASFVVIMI